MGKTCFILILLLFYIGRLQARPVARAFCPALCTCTDWILTCHGTGKWGKLDDVPVITGSAYTFNTVDLGENAITTVWKSNWLPYRRTENLDLHGNQAEKLQKDSFEGLILLKKLNLNSNPLELLENDAFDKLPSLQYLDLPDGVRCCLCYVARTVQILFNSVKLDCSNQCAGDTSCDASETILMINGTVLRSLISLKNQGGLESSFINQNTDTNANLPHSDSFARPSKLGLLHQTEENEKNMHVGNHLDPHQVAAKTKSLPYSSRIRKRPSFENDIRFIPQYGRADNLQLNIGGRKHRSLIPLGNIVSGKNPLHHLYFALSDSYNHTLPLEAGSKSNIQDKDFNFKKHKVIRGVKKELASVQQASNSKEVRSSTVEIPETTIQQPEIIYKFEKAEQKSLLRQALIPEYFSGTLQQSELVHPGDSEFSTISSESWHKPLSDFLDNIVQKNVAVSFSPTPLTETTKKLSLVELVNLFKEAYWKYKEGNYPQPQNEGTKSVQQTTPYPYVDIHGSNKDLFPSVHPKKTIEKSVKTSSSIKSIVDDMFEAKFNEAVQAVEPNKDIQSFFAHLIRMINVDCVKPELEASCTNLLTKIGHLMKEYEGIKYLREDRNWNLPLLRPDENGGGDGEQTEVFPPPIPRPEQEQKEHKGRGGAKINYSEVHTEQPKKMATSSTVGYRHKLLLAVAVTVIVMLITIVICVIEEGGALFEVMLHFSQSSFVFMA